MKLFKPLFTLIFIGIALMAQSENINVNGTVTNQSTGEPVADHLISFIVDGANDTLTTTTNTSGFFTKSIELNQQDSSFFVFVFTADPCNEYIHSASFIEGEDIEFVVCGDTTGQGEECMASFEYYSSFIIDSSFIVEDSTFDMNLLSISFVDLSSGSPTDWNWSFGDGNTSTKQHPVHTYADTGEFVVTLSISGNDCESTETMYVYAGYEYISDSIWGYDDCLAMFFPVMSEGNTVDFINKSMGKITGYYWEFGDESSSTEENPIHTYANKGQYTVKLTINPNDSCSSVFEMDIWVNDFYTDSTFTALFVPTFNGKTVTFHNQSQGDIWSWHWNFGDEATSKVKNPIHTYNELGTYIVTLGIGNSFDISTFTMQINLSDSTYKGYFNKSTTTISEFGLSEVKVFPNPVNEVANVYFQSNENGFTNISITNIAGQTLFNERFNAASGKNKLEINTAFLEKGIYILHVAHGNNIQSYKITK